MSCLSRVNFCCLLSNHGLVYSPRDVGGICSTEKNSDYPASIAKIVSKFTPPIRPHQSQGRAAPAAAAPAAATPSSLSLGSATSSRPHWKTTAKGASWSCSLPFASSSAPGQHEPVTEVLVPRRNWLDLSSLRVHFNDVPKSPEEETALLKLLHNPWHPSGLGQPRKLKTL